MNELNGAGGQREGEQTFKYLGRRSHTCHPLNQHYRRNSAFSYGVSSRTSMLLCFGIV